MKSLYESILSKAGVGLEERIRTWFDGVTSDQKAMLGSSYIDKIEFSRNGAKISCTKGVRSYFVIENRHLEKGDFPFKLDKIVDEFGEEIQLVLRECDIQSFKNFPNHSSIKFLGCAIEDLSGLPKSYSEIEFRHSYSLSGGKTCYIGKCQGLKLDLWSSEGNSYTFAVNRFKNNTIKDFCLCTVGWNDRIHAGDVIKSIVDNNNIKPTDITVMFYNEDRHVKINRGRVEKTKGEYVVVRDASRHPEISNGYYQ